VSSKSLHITQLAGELDLNETTVFRLLNAMQKFELIEKKSRKRKIPARFAVARIGMPCSGIQDASDGSPHFPGGIVPTFE
jgi:hypothetical protein